MTSMVVMYHEAVEKELVCSYPTGPTTAAGMCNSKGWKDSLVPSILVGTLGYAIATFVSLALGYKVLRPMTVR